jgi:hypothetical protein
MLLTNDEKTKLLSIARNTIQEYVSTGKVSKLDKKDYEGNLSRNCGAFVTLHKHGKLRGCIGHFGEDIPLYEVIQMMSIASASKDYRFPKVSFEEFDSIEIEISVLTPMRKIKSNDEIQLGKHGIYIKSGSKGGTFLPQVANDTGWSLDEFLGHCSQDKVGIGWDGWKKADIYIYEAIVFSE